jgi:uncharacterized protein
MSKGQNVWHELMTTDVEAARRFYGEVIGWQNKAWEGADPGTPYSMWMTGDTPVGGLMTLPEPARQAGAPPHWMAYTTVDDVDATTAEATSLGAKVLQPPFDIPTIGRMAFLADPQGAAFAIYRALEPSDPPPEGPGRFSWAELNTTDWEAAWAFYSRLFGWKERSRMEMGPMGTYFMWSDPTEKTKGGMSSAAKHMNLPPHWLHYVTVEDMDATVARVTQHGGKVLHGPMPIPGDDVIAQCQDPQGAAFAVYAKGRR